MIISVDQLKNGMVLQSDVFDESGLLFLSSGTIVTSSLIDRLIDKGILEVGIVKDQLQLEDSAVIIENNVIQKHYADTVLKFKALFKQFRLGKEVPYNEIQEVATPIFDEVTTNPSLARELWRLESVDEATFDHSVIVSLVAALLAKWLDYSENSIKRVAIAGLMHDIGKVTLPENILSKQGTLSEEETKIYRTHALEGYNILKDKSDLPDNVLSAVLYHHENYDGSGFPHGLSGEDIPLMARIVTIANVFSNMIGDKTKRFSKNPYATTQEMLKLSYDVLDPAFIKIFSNGMVNYSIGSIVKLSNGEVGEIILTKQGEPHRPLVKCDSGFIDLSHNRDIEILELIK